MSQDNPPADELANDLAEDLPSDFNTFDIEEMIDVVNDLSDRYRHRELHFLCTGTDILVIYDRENDEKIEIERDF